MSEKKTGKRLLSWVLVLIMALSLLPLNVLADVIPLDEPTGEETMIEMGDATFDEPELAAYQNRKSTTKDAQFYYLKSPNSNPDKNDSSEFGPKLGNGTINTNGLSFTDVYNYVHRAYKNAYNVGGCVISWPDGVDDTGVLAKNTTEGSHWMTIFDAFKSDYEAKNGIQTGTLRPGDVISITLKPHKVSRFNTTIPDHHVDCTVEIICNGVQNVRFFVKDAGANEYQQYGRGQSVMVGNAVTFPTDLPQTQNVNGVEYTFKGWYLGEYENTAPNTSGTTHTEYTVTEGGTNIGFYAYYEPVKTYTVTYNANGGTGTVPKDDREYRLSEEVTVMDGNDLSRGGYEFTGWKIDNAGTTYKEDDTFTITGNTTLYAQWEANKYGYTVKYVDQATDQEIKISVTGEAPVDSTLNAVQYKEAIQGYQFVEARPESLKISTNPENNVITLYYTKATYSYKVNYLWNNKPIPNVNSTTGSAESGAKVTENAPEIPGYTPVKESETITIGTGENVINFNYYKNVTLTANSKEVTYNGNTQFVESYTSDAPEGVTFEGITASGSGTDVGEYTVTINGGEKAVSEDNLYIVTNTVNGTLTIKPRSVTLTSASDSKKYDGTALTNDTVTASGEGFVDGQGATYTVTGTITDVGEVKNAFTYTLNDGTDAKNYTITTTEGKLEVTPNETEVIVTIKGNTATKTYNGEEQSVTGYKVTSSNGLYKESDIKFTGNATAKGTNAGTYKMDLKPADFKNTSKNFSNVKFEVKDGFLTINKCLILITAKDVTTVYNGESPVVKDYTILREVSNGDTVDNLPAGHKIGTYDTYGSGVDAGEYEWFSMKDATILDAGNKDVTSNYEISYDCGKLTINPRKVTLTSASDSKKYDGTALTNGTVTVSGDGFVGGQGATYTVTGTITDVGEVKNAFTYTLNDGTDAKNYTITKNEGKLEVTPNETEVTVTITGKSDSKQYNGSEQSVKGYEVTISAKDTDITVALKDVKAAIAKGTNVGEYKMNLTKDDFTVTSKNYSKITVVVVDGKLTITGVPYYPPYYPPTVKIEDDDALGLNTTDHFAYIVGYGNGEVRPQNNITRAEVATIFFRLLTDDVRDENLTKTNPYSDVAATSWYNTAVSTLSSMGIITGYPDGTFCPNAAITRAEFAAIAARFDNDGDKTAAKFSDIATHWAKDEISIAYNNGWITGYPDGTFGPQRDITRAETMTLVNRVLNRQPETEDDLLPNMTVWTDNANPKAWYYLAVQEATNSHYYEFKTNSQYEKWTELRETRDWKAPEQ